VDVVDAALEFLVDVVDALVLEVVVAWLLGGGAGACLVPLPDPRDVVVERV
jgi:hypothetical protein